MFHMEYYLLMPIGLLYSKPYCFMILILFPLLQNINYPGTYSKSPTNNSLHLVILIWDVLHSTTLDYKHTRIIVQHNNWYQAWLFPQTNIQLTILNENNILLYYYNIIIYYYFPEWKRKIIRAKVLNFQICIFPQIEEWDVFMAILQT